MLDGCGIETDHPWQSRLPLQAGRDRCSMAVESRRVNEHQGKPVRAGSRSMLDGCGIETTTPRGSTSRYSSGRDRCSMAVVSRLEPGSCREVLREPRRDRCSMTVVSRQDRVIQRIDEAIAGARSMLDGCGIETSEVERARKRAAGGRDRCSMAVESRPSCSGVPGVTGTSVAIDARWLWNRDRTQRNRTPSRLMVAIDARWLWNRDLPSASPRTLAGGVAIDARWLWDRDLRRRATFDVRAWKSRSMLDGCGIETPALLSSARTPFVAIDARWLWDRDETPRASVEFTPLGRDRCSMTVGSRPYPPEEQEDRFDPVAIDARWLWDRDTECGSSASLSAGSRSMLDGCGIETR